MPKLKSIAEKYGEKPFDWNQFLHEALKEGINQNEYTESCALAGNWVTCAVGNQCEIIPRKEFEPLDPELLSLGRIFYQLICHTDYYHARIYLRKIEKRSAELIREILGKEASNA